MAGIVPDLSETLAPLGKLGQIYQQAQRQRTRELALSRLGQGAGPLDYATTARALLGAGDTEGGLALARLAESATERARQQQNADRSFGLQERQFNQGNVRDERDFSLRKEEIDRTQRNTDRSHGLQERQFTVAQEGSKVPPGFRPAPGGGLVHIPGGPADPVYKRSVGDRQNAPAGYKWKDPNNPDAGLVAIPGGPGEKVDSEVAARLGLAKSFLAQLEDHTDAKGNPKKGIRTRVMEGQATGLWGGPTGALNIGEAGEVRRQIASGAEALLRNLTGAGMNIDEAKKYVRRYEVEVHDSADTVISKLDQLERELRSVSEVVSQGRGGNILERPGFTTGGPPPAGPPRSAPAKPEYDRPEISEARTAIAKGAPRDKVIQRLREKNIPFTAADLEL